MAILRETTWLINDSSKRKDSMTSKLKQPAENKLEFDMLYDEEERIFNQEYICLSALCENRWTSWVHFYRNSGQNKWTFWCHLILSCFQMLLFQKENISHKFWLNSYCCLTALNNKIPIGPIFSVVLYGRSDWVEQKIIKYLLSPR